MGHQMIMASLATPQHNCSNVVYNIVYDTGFPSSITTPNKPLIITFLTRISDLPQEESCFTQNGASCQTLCHELFNHSFVGLETSMFRKIHHVWGIRISVTLFRDVWYFGTISVES